MLGALSTLRHWARGVSRHLLPLPADRAVTRARCTSRSRTTTSCSSMVETGLARHGDLPLRRLASGRRPDRRARPRPRALSGRRRGARGARRSEAWSVGVGLGRHRAVLALTVHSAFDFGARIPANGVLAAACLGIATVALHTRFAGAGGRLFTAVRVLPLPGGRLGLAIARIGCVALALASVPAIVRRAPRRVEPRSHGSVRIHAGRASARPRRPRTPRRDGPARGSALPRRAGSGSRARPMTGACSRPGPTVAARRCPLFDGAVARSHARRSARGPRIRSFTTRSAGLTPGPRRSTMRPAARARRRPSPRCGGRSRSSRRTRISIARSPRSRSSQREPLMPIAHRRGPECDRARPVAPARSRRPLSAARSRGRGVDPGRARHRRTDRLELAAVLDEAGLGSAALAQYRRAVAWPRP